VAGGLSASSAKEVSGYIVLRPCIIYCILVLWLVQLALAQFDWARVIRRPSGRVLWLVTWGGAWSMPLTGVVVQLVWRGGDAYEEQPRYLKGVLVPVCTASCVFRMWMGHWLWGQSMNILKMAGMFGMESSRIDEALTGD